MTIDDDRMDDMIRDTARSYHEPGATPRDAMWERIASAREASERERARPARRLPWWLGLAAALLLGVAIGRLALSPAGSPAVALDTSAPVVADAGASNADVPAVSDPADPERDAAPVSAGASPLDAAPRTMIASAQQRRAGEVPRAPSREEGRTASPPASEVSSLYRYVAYETLGQAEALLTLYRAEENAEMRGRVAVWARDVLTSTRLLLDSPAAEDVQLASLLRDLELVLAQIAALGQGAAAASDDREMIDEAIRQRDVMPRLRNTLPAGPIAAGASS